MDNKHAQKYNSNLIRYDVNDKPHTQLTLTTDKRDIRHFINGLDIADGMPYCKKPFGNASYWEIVKTWKWIRLYRSFNKNLETNGFCLITEGIFCLNASCVPNESVWYIELICSHEGTGKIMLKQVKRDAKTSKIKFITLSSVKESIGFYVKNGFTLGDGTCISGGTSYAYMTQAPLLKNKIELLENETKYIKRPTRSSSHKSNEIFDRLEEVKKSLNKLQAQVNKCSTLTMKRNKHQGTRKNPTSAEISGGIYMFHEIS